MEALRTRVIELLKPMNGTTGDYLRTKVQMVKSLRGLEFVVETAIDSTNESDGPEPIDEQHWLKLMRGILVEIRQEMTK